MANGEEDGHGEGSQQKEKDNDGFTTVPVKNSSSNTQTLSSRGRKNRKGKNAASPPKNLVTLVEERAQELRRDGYPERCLCARALRSVLTHLTHLMIIPSRLPSCAALLQDARPHLFASTSCRRCICFGLGSLRDSPQSQLQLALLQDLLVAFKVCWRPARRAYLLGFSLINQSLPSQLDEPLLVVDPAFAEEDETFFVEQGYRISPYSVSDATASRGRKAANVIPSNRTTCSAWSALHFCTCHIALALCTSAYSRKTRDAWATLSCSGIRWTSMRRGASPACPSVAEDASR